MVRWIALLTAALLTLDISWTVTNAAERFLRLAGDKIHSRFAGMELSDGVHWRDKFTRDGTLQSISMGRIGTGKWWVKNDELCMDRGKDSGGCYQVWVAGRKVEFRREGLEGAILEGSLEKPADH